MRVRMTVYERMVLMNVLPATGDYSTLRIVRRLREALSFTDAEHEAYQPHQNLRFKCLGCDLEWTTDELTEPELEAFNDAGGSVFDCPRCERATKGRPTGQVSWRPDVDPNTEVEISGKGKDIIRNVLKDLDNDKKLNDGLYGLYEGFVAEENGKGRVVAVPPAEAAVVSELGGDAEDAELET